jgi:hypothetical protein
LSKFTATSERLLGANSHCDVRKYFVANLKRREFIKLLGSTAVSALPLHLLWPATADAQNPVRADQPAADPAGKAESVGQVATLQGSATVTRGSPATAAVPLRVKDPVFTSDTLATGANSTLGVTFDDETTFSLSASTRIVVNAFIYQEGGGNNAAAFNVAVGMAAFVASLVAKTGDMKISTPTATLGIRGTTGVVDVPEGGGAGEPKIKLYPDADGHVGQIEVFNRQGGRLGTLTQGASAFVIRSGPGGSLRAEPFQIRPQEASRDRGVLQRLNVSHDIGRRMTNERLRTRGPGRPGERNPRQPGRSPEERNRNPREPGRSPQELNRNPREPGRSPQELNRNPRQGGPPRPPSAPRKGNPGDSRRGH